MSDGSIQWDDQAAAPAAPASALPTLTRPNIAAAAPAAAAPSVQWDDATPAAAAAPTLTKPDTGDFMRGFKTSAHQLPQLGGGALAFGGDVLSRAGKAVGGDGAAGDAVTKYGLDVYKKQDAATQALSKDSDSFTHVLQHPGEIGHFLKYNAGYMGGQLAEGAAVMGLGALAGSEVPGVGNAAGAVAGLVAKPVVERAILKKVAQFVAEKGMSEEAATAAAKQAVNKKLGAEAGAAIAGGALNTGQELGSIYPDALDQAKRDGRTLTGGDLARVGGSAVAAGAVDTLAERLNLGDALKGVKVAEGAGKSALRQRLEATGKTVLTDAARGGATEAAQTVAERFGAGQSMTDPAAVQDYVDSTAAGVVGGGLTGAGAGLHTQHAAVPHPDAAPGSLSDAVNTMAQPAGPLGRAAQAATEAAAAPTPAPIASPSPVAAPTAVPADATPTDTAPRMAPIVPPWINPATGETTQPDQGTLTATLARHIIQQFDEQGHMRINTGEIADAWGVPKVDINRARNAATKIASNAVRNRPAVGADVGTPPLNDQAPPLNTGASPLNSADSANERSAAPEQPSTVASVPFMVTQKMKAELRALGHTDADIASMNPQQAHDVLRAGEPVLGKSRDLLGHDQPAVDQAVSEQTQAAKDAEKATAKPNAPSGNSEPLPTTGATDGNERVPGPVAGATAATGAQAASQADAEPAARGDHRGTGDTAQPDTAVPAAVGGAGAAGDTHAAVAETAKEPETASNWIGADRAFTHQAKGEHDPGQASPEAMAFARGAKAGTTTLETTIRPSGREWHHLYVSDGKGEFSSLSIGSQRKGTLAEAVAAIKDRDAKYADMAAQSKAIRDKETSGHMAVAEKHGFSKGAKLGNIVPNTGKMLRVAHIVADHGNGTFDVQGFAGSREAIIRNLPATDLARAVARHALKNEHLAAEQYLQRRVKVGNSFHEEPFKNAHAVGVAIKRIAADPSHYTIEKVDGGFIGKRRSQLDIEADQALPSIKAKLGIDPAPTAAVKESLTAGQKRTSALLGANVGDTVRTTGMGGEIQPGSTWKIERIDNDGTLHISSPGGGTSSWKRSELEREVRKGATFEKLPAAGVSPHSLEKGRVADTEVSGDATQAHAIEPQTVDRGKVVSDLLARVRARNTAAGEHAMNRPLADSKLASDSTAGHAFRKELDTHVDVPAGKPSRGIKASLAQATRDGLAADAHLFGNAANGSLIRARGFDALDIQRQHVVVNSVRRALHDREIAQRIVELLPVDVVNNLASEKVAANGVGHDGSVRADGLAAAFDDSVGVARSAFIDKVAASLPEALALRVAKEITAPGDAPRGSIKGRAAVSAIGKHDENHSVVSTAAPVAKQAAPKPAAVADESAAKPTKPGKPTNTKDAGEELWANRRNSTGKGIGWNDISDLNATLKAREAVKSKVWPRPDYAALVEGGMPAPIAHVIKQVYDALAVKPQASAPTDQHYQNYIGAVQKVRAEAFAWAKQVMDKTDGMDASTTDRVAAVTEGKAMGSRDAAAIVSALQLAKGRNHPIQEAVFPMPAAEGSLPPSRYRTGAQGAANNALANLLGGNKIVRAMQVDESALRDATRAIEKGWPAAQEAWEKTYTIHETKAGEKVYSNGVDRVLTAPEFWVSRKAGTRFRSIVADGFTTREQAVEAAKAAYAKARKQGGDGAKAEAPVELQNARSGPARRGANEDVSSDQLRETFGFKGINFGNWMKGDGAKNVAERQAHLNHAYDAFHDLAEIMGVPPRAMSLDGMLGIAVGAQGSGGKNAFAAHFIPGINEINLTREQGAGSLAHEWAHALDHYFAAKAGTRLGASKTPFLTEHLGRPLDGVRPEVLAAFKTIVDSMQTRPETDAERTTRLSGYQQRARNGVETLLGRARAEMEKGSKGDTAAALAQFDELAKRLRVGDVGEGYLKTGKGRMDAAPQVVAQLANLVKETTGHKPDWIDSLASNARAVNAAVSAKSDNAERALRVPSDYAKEARKLEGTRTKPYWTTKLEMFARAFQSYVLDKLATGGNRNSYLTRDQMDPATLKVAQEMGMGEAGDRYPRGAERATINQAFDTLVGDLKTETRDDGRVALFSKDDEPSDEPFYSALTRSVETAKGAPKSADAGAWQQWMDGAQRRGEFKQAEREWLGVDAWLAEQKGPVTREQLQQFVRDNQVQVQETELADEHQKSPQAIVQRAMDLFDETNPSADEDHRHEAESAAKEWVQGDIPIRDAAIAMGVSRDALGRIKTEENKATKFSSYQLPGGTNYRELLLTLPDAKKDRRAELERQIDALTAQRVDASQSEDDRLLDEIRPLYDELNKGTTGFRSSHFDQPNILAHVRFNERADGAGKKVLFLEEVQSDWHQAGRRSGYQTELKELPQGYDLKPNSQDNLQLFDPAGRRVGGTFESKADALQFLSSAGVPDAPLKKEWPMLAIKRMVRYAAENGFDRIGWTTGEQQAERYDLSKQVSAIRYAKNGDGNFDLEIDLLTGGTREEHDLSSERVEGFVGKDIAAKMVAGEGTKADGVGNDDMLSLSGVNLKVGGEGMQAFYDRMLPNEVNKWAKPFGAKVDSTRFVHDNQAMTFAIHEKGNAEPYSLYPTRAAAEKDLKTFGDPSALEIKPYDGSEGVLSAHSLDITPAMRLAALNGQPLFSFAGEHAATADHGALDQAKQMEAMGRDSVPDRNGNKPGSPEDTHTATGWHRGVDGKWRFEIDDSAASIRPSMQDSTTNGSGQHAQFKLGEVLDHPALFDAYPNLADVNVRVDLDMRGLGVYHPGANTIEIRSPAAYANTGDRSLKSVLLHEIQHAIQQREGFARGGSSAEARTLPEFEQSLRQYMQEHNGELPAWNEVKPDHPAAIRAAQAVYRRLAGEVEARNTQTRMGLSDAERRAMPPSETADVPRSQQIVRFNGTTPQALAHDESATPAQDAHAAKVRQIANAAMEKWKGDDVPRLIVVATPEQLPAFAKRDPSYKRGAGMYDGKNIYIVASKHGADQAGMRKILTTMAHEGVGHYGVERIVDRELGAGAWKKIESATERLRQNPALASASIREVIASVEKRYAGADAGTFAREFLAVTAERGVKNGLLDRAVTALRKFLRRVLPDLNLSEHELRQLLVKSDEFMQHGESYAQRVQATQAMSFSKDDDLSDPKPKRAFSDASASIEAIHDQLPQLDRSAYQHVKDWISGKARDLEPLALGGLQLRHVLELAGEQKVLEAPAKHYADIYQRMDGDRNTMTQEGAAKVDALNTWARAPGAAGWLQGKLRPEANQLFKFMHAVTQIAIDPTSQYQRLLMRDSRGEQMPWTKELIKERIKVLREQQLGRPGDDKTAMQDEIKELRKLPSRERARAAKYPELVAAWNALSPKAQEQFVTMREHYKQQSEALEQATIEHIQSLDIPAQNKLAAAALIRKNFADSKVGGVYFPLSRFGDYWLSGETKDGEYVFAKYESAQAQQQAEKRFLAAGATINARGRQDNNYRAKDAISGTFMGDLMGVLRKGNAPESVQNEIYQMYLKALPDLSLRKHGIHRNNVAGYTDDVPRAFASSVFHGAHQVSKARYGWQLQNTLEHMRGTVEGNRGGMAAAEASHADALLGEINRRHDWIMNPTNSKLANKLTSIAFAYYIAASPASALVNLIQVPQITLPVLGAHHGWPSAMKVLGASMRDAIRTGGHIERVLKGEDLMAFKALQQQGTFQRTATHSLAGIAEGDQLRASPAYTKVMNAVSWMFHTSEVINREGTGIAAFRLARIRGDSFENAVKYADEMTNGTHGDYSNAGRARYMQGNVPKVALQFKNYSLAMSWLWGRTFYKAFKGETPEVKAIARRTLTGMLGMTGLFAGVIGMPIFNLLRYGAQAVHAATGDDDEPWDFLTEFRSWLAEHLGETAAAVIADGAASQLGANVASRVSMSDLWFRDADKELEGEDAYNAMLQSIAGPLGGLVKNMYVGSKQFNDGHTERGIETMLPTFAKNAVKAVRFAHEGVTSLRGDPIVPDVTAPQALIQAMGFQPTKVAEQQRTNNALMNYSTFIQDRRQGLMNAFAMAQQAGDEEGRGDTLTRIQAFNAKYPEIAIRMSNLHASLRQRARFSAEADNGIHLNRKIADRVRQEVGVPQP